jgi:uncharacterized protein
MKLKILEAKDRAVFNRFLSVKKHELSVYAFENIYIWGCLYTIKWALVKDNLCVFFSDKLGTFMYLPPVGKNMSLAAVEESFRFMEESNFTNSGISRIENLEDDDAKIFRSAGYKIYPKFPEYICSRRDIATLAGNRFKSQRSSFNYFIKNNSFEILPFTLEEKYACISLYKDWAKARARVNPDPVYSGMMSDSLKCLNYLFSSWQDLKIEGRIVRINNAVKAFTLGFKINKDIFCIIFEITDLSVKGLSQFIFSSFCSSLEECSWINIMDDSGLENLKKTKLLYHPREVAAYVALRQAHG